MKLVEWNIHKMKNNIHVKPFVHEQLLKQEADIICLVEYLDDYEIKNRLNEHYWVKESNASSGNQILIAVNKKIAPIEIKIIGDTEKISCYNFLHISFTDNHNKKLSIIGVRMLWPIDANVQTPPLNKYLAQIEESFICTGDFNIKGNRMSYWFPEYEMEKLQLKTEKINNSSFVFTKKETKKIMGFGDLDHVLTSNDLLVKAEYEWKFIKDDEIYPDKSKLKINEVWNISPGFPDHAMLICNIENKTLTNIS